MNPFRTGLLAFIGGLALFSSLTAQELVWERIEYGYACDVTVDPEGNVVALLHSDGDEVLKYSPDGELLWRVRGEVGGNGAITTDMWGNIVKIYSMAIVTKLSPQGEVLWEKDLRDTCSYLGDVDCDDQGNIFVCGDDGAVFTAKLSPEGGLLWVQMGSREGSGNACAVDPWGDVIVAATELGPGYPSYTEYDWVIYKYSFAGEKLWERREGSLSYEIATAACVDNDGNAYVGGNEWIAKYDRNGNLVWFDPGGLCNVGCLCYDGESSIYAGVGMDIEPVRPQIVRCDLDGNILWMIPGVGAPGGAVRGASCWGPEYLAVTARPAGASRLITAKYWVGENAAPSSQYVEKGRLEIFPNPAWEGATIVAAEPMGNSGRVCVFDLMGRRVKRIQLTNERGWWDCSDDSGRRVHPGTYVCRLEGCGHSLGTTYVVITE